MDVVLLKFKAVNLLTILRNERGDYFFCVCCEIKWEQRWIISPATKDEVRQFLQNKMSARAFFKQGEKNSCGLGLQTTCRVISDITRAGRRYP